LTMMRLRALAESRGATRILQIVFSIVCMAVIFGFSQRVSVTVNCKPTTSAFEASTREVSVIVSYPFDLFGDITYDDCTGNSTTVVQSNSGYTSKSQFYMSSIFLVFLSSIAYVIIYAMYESKLLYMDLPYYKIDFGITATLALYSFIAAIIMSIISTGVRADGSPEALTKLLPECNQGKVGSFTTVCTHGRTMDDSDLAISTCLAWIQVVLAGGMLWFTYKEVKDGT